MESREERLLAAAQNGDLQKMQTLIETGVQVNAKGYSGMTALMHAAKNNHIACVEALMKAGAEVNAVNELGRTASKMAAANGHRTAVEMLQTAGATDRPQVTATGAELVADLAGEYKRRMMSGLLWAVGGTIVTAISYNSAASGGGTYFVFWGAIIFGIIDFFRGLFGWLSHSA